jgi:hypothetical protein
MITASEIEQMSQQERLQTIDLLWEFIARDSSPRDSPEGHEEILRLAKIAGGEGVFSSLEETREYFKDRL